MSESLNIVIDDTPSIDFLAGAARAGISVMRTAHVGNLSPYNLTLAQAGIPLCLVDHNLTGVDKNYRPEIVDSGDGMVVAAPLARIVTRATVSLPGKSEDGRYLDLVHVGAMRQAIPNGSFFTDTEYLRDHESTVAEIVRLSAQGFPGLFQRFVLPDGTTIKRPEKAADHVVSRGIVELQDDPRKEEGVIIPNEVDIVANVVIEALAKGEQMYHISGPDMVRYIGGITTTLQDLYGLVRERASFGHQLPHSPLMRLVPAAGAKFATTRDRQDQLDEVVNSLVALEEGEAFSRQQRAAFFQNNQTLSHQEKAAFVAPLTAQKIRDENRVGEALVEAPEVFAQPGEAGFVSQYDVRQKGLYIHPSNLALPVSVLAQRVKALTKLKK